ncbi:CRISPR-associated endonuclease Cas1 [uncultured Thiohalocapsa sp.]|uniref:CRISPR-associated endonuclease Cas1 n=1 Tax=uncultured Thiohalocapsa sp. TaxID=768990 RepID=UPI0025D907C1|nr:CRISPR-associated endonuclease Cas1 [uncultured Thiohalocapsa sp.]
MPTDLILVLDRRDTDVRLDGRALRVKHGDAPPAHIPLGVVGQVIVHGAPRVSCDVWRALAERGVPAVLQPGRGRGATAMIGAALGGTIELRAAQHRAADDPAAALRISAHLLRAKLRAQMQAARHLSGLPPPLPTAADLSPLERALNDGQDRIDRARTPAALMGAEGAAAAAWYRWLAAWLPTDWGFGGRNRRPPRDPLNALLSLGYTLLAGEVLGAVQQAGLDPARGFLHGTVPGRESLVLDLMEALRPAVDLVAIGLLFDWLDRTDFSNSPAEGCRLAKPARGVFYQRWALARGDWPQLLPPPAPARSQPAPPTQAADTDATTAPTTAEPQDHSLPRQCRWRVEALREWLRPHLRAGD